MIDAVLREIVSLLRNAGIDAVLQYPATALDRRRGPLVCAAVKEGTRTGSGFGDYLGIREENGAMLEVYGCRVELTVSLDIFVPWGEESVSAAMQCFTALSEALYAAPSGLKPLRIHCGTAKPDRETEMLKCPVEVECIAVLLCERNTESGEFTEFVLKGVLQS